jgi:trimeric autotransporter adhesin
VDEDGNLFIADPNNNRVRRVDRITGIITTVVGSFRGVSGDKGPARNAKLNEPWGLGERTRPACRSVLRHHHYGRRQRSRSSQRGWLPRCNAGRPQPIAVGVDPSGDLLMASDHTIRRVNHATGIIITTTTIVGGNGRGFSGDPGAAVKAQISTAQAIVEDSSGNWFIADTGNHHVRRVDHATRLITTVVGTGAQG